MDLLAIGQRFCNDKTNEKELAITWQAIKTFVEKHEKTFTFESVFTKEEHEKFLYILFELIMDNNSTVSMQFKLDCLFVIRLLSRDKILVTSIKDIDSCLSKFTVFLKQKNEKDNGDFSSCKIEVLKCLCNWIYHSSKVREYLVRETFTKGMILEIVEHNLPIGNYLFYQVRIMFLMSVLEKVERTNMLQCDVLGVLVNILEKVNKIVDELGELSEMNRNILCEILKALFNITIDLSKENSEKLISDCSKLVRILSTMLARYNEEDDSSADNLLTHISHLLMNLPKESLDNLCPEILPDEGSRNSDGDDEVGQTMKDNHAVKFQGRNMSTVIDLLSALEKRMKIHNYSSMKEKTLAVLTSFCYMCRIHPLIRKYLRKELLPPIVVSDLRPEEQTDTRGDIVRLMTTVDVPLKNMAAHFIFVLCKENTTRLVRYAGYGNSAGYIASNGLMPCMAHVEGDYSEDELTDIEDEDLDVMTGATAQPKQDPFAGLTEEEKEAEAEKLMNMIARLRDLNVIKPVTVGKDLQTER